MPRRPVLPRQKLRFRQPPLKTLSLLQLSSVPHVKRLSRKPSRFVAFKSSAQRAVLSWSQMRTTKTSKCLWGKKLLLELW